MRRRRLLLGLMTLAFGSSAAAMSGAVNIGSIGSSGGRDWVRLDERDITAESGDLEPVSGGDDLPDGHDPGGEVRVQIVRDPSGSGPNRARRLAARPRFVDSIRLEADRYGFLERINLGGMNPRAITRIGRLAGTGTRTARQRVAFMIANVGGLGRPGVGGQAVEIELTLYDEQERALRADGLRLPWAIDGQRAGPDLFGTPVQLAPGESVGVSIVVDGTLDDPVVTRARRIGIDVRRLDGSS